MHKHKLHVTPRPHESKLWKVPKKKKFPPLWLARGNSANLVGMIFISNDEIAGIKKKSYHNWTTYWFDPILGT